MVWGHHVGLPMLERWNDGFCWQSKNTPLSPLLHHSSPNSNAGEVFVLHRLTRSSFRRHVSSPLAMRVPRCRCSCLERTAGTRVNGSGLGILDGKTSGYFLTSVASGYFLFISGYVDWLVMSVIGLAAPKPTSQVSAGISISCRYSTSGLNSISGSTFIPRPTRARDRVTMAQDGPAPGRVTRVSDRFSGALGRNPTRRTDRCDLRYGLDLNPYLLLAISSNYLLN